MNLKVIVPVLFIFLLCIGLFFFGKGITGQVVSQSCCFGPDCNPEYLCDVSVTPQKNASFMGMGIIFVLVSALVFVMLHSRVNSI